MSITSRPPLIALTSNSLPNKLEYEMTVSQPSEIVEIWDDIGVLESLRYSQFLGNVKADISNVINSFLNDNVLFPNENSFVLDTNFFKEYYIKTSAINDVANKRFAIKGRNTEFNFDYLPYSFLPLSFGIREIKYLNKIFPIPFYKDFGSIISTFFVKNNGNYVDAITNTQQVTYNGSSGLLRFRANEIDSNGLATFGFRGYDNTNQPYCGTENVILELQTCYEKVLFWVNSLGGIDSFPFKGFQKTFELVTTDNYLPYPSRTLQSLKRIKKEVTTLNTYVPSSQIQAFCEVYTSNNVFLFENGIFTPVNVRNDSQIIFESNRKDIFEMVVNVERFINE